MPIHKTPEMTPEQALKARVKAPAGVGQGRKSHAEIAVQDGVEQAYHRLVMLGETLMEAKQATKDAEQQERAVAAQMHVQKAVLDSLIIVRDDAWSRRYKLKVQRDKENEVRGESVREHHEKEMARQREENPDVGLVGKDIVAIPAKQDRDEAYGDDEDDDGDGDGYEESEETEDEAGEVDK